MVFGAGHCRPSLNQIRDMDGIEDYAAPARFARIDAILHDDARRRMDVRCLPTTVLFRDGVVHKMLTGYHSRARIEAIVHACGRQAAPLAA